MTIKECLAQLSAEDLDYVKEYYESILPFEVEPSATYEFDGNSEALMESASMRGSPCPRIIKSRICSAPAVPVVCVFTLQQ